MSRDIANNVRDGFRGAGADFDREGRTAGQRLGRAASEGVNEGRNTSRFKSAGQKIGSVFSDGMRDGFGKTFKQRVLPAMTNSVRDGTRRAFSNTGRDISRSFDIKSITRLGRKVSSEFGKNFNLGIGAARMGPAIIGALALAAPSVLSGVSALGVAVGSQLVSSLAATGPALAGALGVVAAGAATALLNFGLLKVALSSSNEEMLAAVKNFSAFNKELGNIVAGSFASGLSSLGDSLNSVLGNVKDLLTDTGKAFGDVATKLGEVVTRADNLARIRSILATNNSFIKTFGDGLTGLSSSFLILFASAKPFIDAIAGWTQQFGSWAEKTLAAKEASGELSSFFETLVGKFEHGVQTLSNLTGGLYNVFKAAASGKGNLSDLAQRFNDWTGNAANQERMIAFFDKMHVLASGLGKLFGQLITAAGGALEKMNPANLLAVFEIIGTKIGPALADLWNQVQAGAGANLVKIFDNLGTMLQKIVDSGTFEKIAGFISGFLVKLSELASSDIGSTIAAWLIPIALFGGTITSLVGPLTTIIGIFTGPIAGIAAIIAGIAAAFVLVWTQSENFRNAIMGLVDIVKNEFSQVWDNIAPKIQPIWEKIKELAGVIGDLLGPAIEALTPVFEFFVNAIGAGITYIVDFISNLLDVVTGLLTGDWSRAWEGAKGIVTSFWTFLQDVFGGVVSWLGGVISDAWNAVFEATSNGLGNVRDFIVGIWDGIFSYLEGVWNDITSAASSIWNGISEFFTSLWNGVTAAFTSVWNGIGDILSGIWNGIVSIAEGIWNGLLDFFSMLWGGVQLAFQVAWDAIVNTLVGIWNGIFDYVTTTFEPIITYLGNIWAQIQQLWQMIWDAIVTSLTNIWNTIAAVATVVWNGITTAISATFSAISGVATTVWNAISSFLSSVWSAISGVASTIWNGITTAISATVTAVQSFISGVWNAVTSFLSTTWNTIAAFATSIWNNITSAVSAAVSAAQAVIISIWNAVSSALSSIWNAISSAASSIWSGITSALSSAVSAAQSVITSVWESISSTLSSIWEGISSTASSIWGGIVGIASSIWNNITSTISSIAEAVVGVLSGIWDTIVAGFDVFSGAIGIVQAAWEGISNAITGPIGAAVGAVQAIIDTIIGIVQGAWETISGIVSSITGALSTAKNAVAEAASTNLTLPSVKLPGQGVAGLPPGAATGGIFQPTPGGTTIRVAEANKLERVEPLDSSGLSTRDRAIIKQLAGSNEAPVLVSVTIGERELNDIIDTQVTRGVSSVARTIKNGRRN